MKQEIIFLGEEVDKRVEQDTLFVVEKPKNCAKDAKAHETLIRLDLEEEIRVNLQIALTTERSHKIDIQIKLNKPRAEAYILGRLVMIQGHLRINSLLSVGVGGRQAKGNIDIQGIASGQNIIWEAFPNLDIQQPNAKVTHKAVLRRLDEMGLQTLQRRGLTEQESKTLLRKAFLGEAIIE